MVIEHVRKNRPPVMEQSTQKEREMERSERGMETYGERDGKIWREGGMIETRERERERNRKQSMLWRYKLRGLLAHIRHMTLRRRCSCGR